VKFTVVHADEEGFRYLMFCEVCGQLIKFNSAGELYHAVACPDQIGELHEPVMSDHDKKRLR